MLKKIIITGLIVSAFALFAADSTKHQVLPEKCIGCTLCVQSCPVKAIQMNGNKAVIDPAKCVNCGLCASKCPVKAIIGPTEKPKEVKPAPEKKKVSFKVDINKCTGCTECAVSCPVKAISMIRGKALIDPEKCITCGLCQKSCRTSAPFGTGI